MTVVEGAVECSGPDAPEIVTADDVPPGSHDVWAVFPVQAGEAGETDWGTPGWERPALAVVLVCAGRTPEAVRDAVYEDPAFDVTHFGRGIAYIGDGPAVQAVGAEAESAMERELRAAEVQGVLPNTVTHTPAGGRGADLIALPVEASTGRLYEGRSGTGELVCAVWVVEE
ncbi:hypothetical protein [Streptomyces sp. NPDC058486]|uniref:hypothetical protein n=1 Tax=unclassified Streptomyces TaxID=2593676 RepID=UPI003647E79B